MHIISYSIQDRAAQAMGIHDCSTKETINVLVQRCKPVYNGVTYFRGRYQVSRHIASMTDKYNDASQRRISATRCKRRWLVEKNCRIKPQNLFRQLPKFYHLVSFIMHRKTQINMVFRHSEPTSPGPRALTNSPTHSEHCMHVVVY